MEYIIGEIFEYNGEWYQCVKSPDGSCKHCDMNFDGKCPIPIKECVASARSDLSYVIFKKLEKVGEPYIFSNMSIHNITMQRYKVFVKPIFTNNSIITTYNMVNETISIEIKNKEDMEESVEEKLFCDKVAKANAEYMKVKLNSSLKPFDIEAAKAGKPVCTRDGRKARIICFDAQCDKSPIIALIENGKNEEVHKFHKDGKLFGLDEDEESFKDLMMLSKKKEGWVNIYKSDNGTYYTGAIFYEKNDALVNTAEIEITTGIPIDCIDTVKIEWEE